MRTYVVVCFLVIAGFGSAIYAQTPATAPKPDPELKKLETWVGRWTYEQEYKPGPLGPGDKVTGEMKWNVILGGFFGQGWFTEKGANGVSHNLEIDGYDTLSKKSTFTMFYDSGTTASGTYSFSSAKEWSFEGKLCAGGKEYPLRGKGVFAPDMKSFTFSGEISTDGKTWAPWWDGKYTKSEPAAKK